MRRREFITLVGGATAWPLAARAQQPTMPVIGFLNSGSSSALQHLTAAFRQGLNESGYIEDRNVAVEYRWADGRYDRLAELAADLVRRSVTVIAAAGVAAALAAKAATATIPIVFVTGVDPVGLGLVASLSRPGGNLTGVTDLTTELGQKQLEVLHELVPSATRVALLVNPANPNAQTLSRELRGAGRILGIEIHVVHASSERELDAAFVTAHEMRLGALVIGTDALFNSRSHQLAKLAAQYALPAIHTMREFAVAGGLMSYGGGLTDATARSAFMPAAFSKVRDQPTCRSSSPPDSS